MVAVTLLGFGAASADEEVVHVDRHERSTAGIILKDTVAGGLVGSAVAGGVILYNMGIEDNDDYNWERTLAWGAIAGLGAGLLFGVIDAADEPDHYAAASRAPVRDGYSLTMNRKDQSNKTMMPLLSRRF
jgi:hypothetical protein